MTRLRTPESHTHGPENAEHELKKAYNCAIEVGVTHFWDRHSIAGVHSDEVFTIYKRGFNALRSGDRLAAERWARTAKHLARAFWHEAKIAYLEPRSSELPYLEGALDEYSLREREDTTADLLESCARHCPPGMSEMPPEMKLYLNRGRKHLEKLAEPAYKHELLRAERIKAAHEYGRVLECVALAYEAEAKPIARAA